VFYIQDDFWPLNTTLYVKDFHGNDPLFVSYLLRTIDFHSHSGKSGVPGVNRNDLHEIVVTLPPTKAEQEAIAEALSDADALIESLEQLIAKKHHLKQGAMQELLTGKKRLPVFHGEWEVKRVGDVVTPRSERIDPRKSGVQEFCVELEHIGSATGSLLGSTSTGEQSSLKSVFRAGDVLFGKLRAYLRKYWWADRPGVCSTEIWVFSPRESLISSAYLFQIVQADKFIEAASSSYGTHMPRSDWNVVKNYELPLPPTMEEQTAIATILSDMDTEIAGLEGKLAKARQIKQGMMQELLTGRIRLV
jgi:type I restriction enzyme S subunit